MQMQLNHDPVEDRLLLRLALGDRHLGYWLTRRMLGLLWPVLWGRLESGLEAAARQEARQWLLAHRHQQARETQTVAEAPPIELTTLPRLVVTVQHGQDERGQHVLGFLDGAGEGETLTLDDGALHALIRLIHDVAPATGWSLDLGLPQESTAALSPYGMPALRH